jgi:capsular polysaccharide export protein
MEHGFIGRCFFGSKSLITNAFQCSLKCKSGDLNVTNLKHTRCASYLFLQGPASPFFTRLAAALRDRGHQVWRINFNGGDRAFWRHPGAIDYLDNENNFSAFLTRQFTHWSITDIVLLGDCRPLHKLAIEAAKFFGVKTHIFEEGYIRPNWITLEHSGVNGFSSLPRDIDSFLAAASRLGAELPSVELPSKLSHRAFDDVVYSFSTMLMKWRYPNYKRHWPYGQLEEYWYGGRRLFARTINNRSRERAIAEIINREPEYYVFPMQVDVDSQIIFHSQFNGQADVIKSVIKSFALNAPQHSTLVITEHPLETSPTNWRRLVTEQAAAFDVTSRVCFFAGGSPKELLEKGRGIVVVNSTTGHQGLELGVPVIALSPAVFNLTGVTFQGGLDRFWTESRPANLNWINAFRRVIIDRTQLNGGFFSKTGIATAIANAIPRMEAVSCDMVALTNDEKPEPTPAARELKRLTVSKISI